jgi:hypothetical protein
VNSAKDRILSNSRRFISGLSALLAKKVPLAARNQTKTLRKASAGRRRPRLVWRARSGTRGRRAWSLGRVHGRNPVNDKCVRWLENDFHGSRRVRLLQELGKFYRAFLRSGGKSLVRHFVTSRRVARECIFSDRFEYRSWTSPAPKSWSMSLAAQLDAHALFKFLLDQRRGLSFRNLTIVIGVQALVLLVGDGALLEENEGFRLTDRDRKQYRHVHIGNTMQPYLNKIALKPKHSGGVFV